MASTSPIAATPMAFVRAIVSAYQHYGRNPTRALHQAQIAPEQLAMTDACITARQMETLSGTAMQELDDEALGWFSRRLPWGSYGMLARASISAPTLGVAISRWCRHHGLIAPDIALELHTAGDTATIRITEHAEHGALGGEVAGAQNPPPPHHPELLREFCLVSVLRNIHGLACWLVDSRIPLRGAEFPFAPPPHADAYSVLFSGVSRFQQAQAAIIFDANYLNLALRRDEKALQQMLQHALPLTVLQYRRDRLLVQRVRQTLVNHAQQTHSAQVLAALLHVSPRTLHRQLKEEGATLQGLKDEIRKARAIELLQRTGRPIKQVAEAAGFRNEKSFIRAFKGWSGTSPAEFRKQSKSIYSTP